MSSKPPPTLPPELATREPVRALFVPTVTRGAPPLLHGVHIVTAKHVLGA